MGDDHATPPGVAAYTCAGTPMKAPAWQVVHWPDYDIIYAEPGACGAIACASCGSLMTVTRHVPGAAGRYTSPAAVRPPRPRDIFVCPHAHTAWHARATASLRRSTNEVSATLRALIDAERSVWVEAHLSPAEPPDAEASTAPPANGTTTGPSAGAARRHAAGRRHPINAGWQAPR